MEIPKLKDYDPVIQTYIKDNRYTDDVEKSPLEYPPQKRQGIRYAIAQGPSQVVGKHTIKQAIDFNMKTMATACRLAKQHKAQLISFPELFLSGYDFGHLDGKSLAYDTAHWIKKNGYLDDHTSPIAKIAVQNQLTIICPLPYAGLDPQGNDGIFDVAMVFGRNGVKRGVSYKLHLWGKEERDWFSLPYFPESMDPRDNYQNKSNPFRTYLINGIAVGISLCYDAEFPEVARCLSLNGALLNVMPTAAPEMTNDNGTSYPDVSRNYIQANALTNHNFCSYGNRAQYEYRNGHSGDDAGYLYSGNSIICDPYGQDLIKPLGNQDALLIADCLIADYPATQPEDTHYLIGRRPELYHAITKRENVPFPFNASYDYPKKSRQEQSAISSDKIESHCDSR